MVYRALSISSRETIHTSRCVEVQDIIAALLQAKHIHFGAALCTALEICQIFLCQCVMSILIANGVERLREKML
jgi:hypothetical protein